MVYSRNSFVVITILFDSVLPSPVKFTSGTGSSALLSSPNISGDGGRKSRHVRRQAATSSLSSQNLTRGSESAILPSSPEFWPSNSSNIVEPGAFEFCSFASTGLKSILSFWRFLNSWLKTHSLYFTGPVFTSQRCFNCRTCVPNDTSLGCCLRCSETCHSVRAYPWTVWNNVFVIQHLVIGSWINWDYWRQRDFLLRLR